MHMYMILRGMEDRVNRFKNDALAQYYPYEYKKGEMRRIQLSMRPIQLYEVVFPAPAVKDVIANLQPYSDLDAGMGFMMRKMLKLSPMKEEWKGLKITDEDVKTKYPMYHDFVDKVCIGFKEDKYDEDGVEII